MTAVCDLLYEINVLPAITNLVRITWHVSGKAWPFMGFSFTA
ncbi:hypothetical protein P775_15860 [Puniceibacterium antarcticum]|uniref:Uncharacterized protein n=1 Tax=Puniceibacterium antarcticum TaxID=1206336 RepID=A0A2G8RCB8_9RHOB|nr:hypothetical protein P775_15860 [Puniceibacterium antarcticum]